MTHLDTAVERLARRMAVARLGLAQGGPTALLPALIEPVLDAGREVLRLESTTEQPSFEAVDQPIGPATTDVLADIVSPVPAASGEPCAMGTAGCVFGMRLHNGAECRRY